MKVKTMKNKMDANGRLKIKTSISYKSKHKNKNFHEGMKVKTVKNSKKNGEKMKWTQK
jgi:hypothetical protein